jgi:hypothetical protein
MLRPPLLLLVMLLLLPLMLLKAAAGQPSQLPDMLMRVAVLAGPPF